MPISNRLASDTDALQKTHRRRYNKAVAEFSRSGAVRVIVSELSRSWWRRFFWLSPLSTFRLALPLSVLRPCRRASLLLLLRVLLWLLRRLTVTVLHPLSLAARFTCRS